MFASYFISIGLLPQKAESLTAIAYGNAICKNNYGNAIRNLGLIFVLDKKTYYSKLIEVSKKNIYRELFIAGGKFL